MKTAISLVALVVLGLLLSTRIGVYLVFDVIGDLFNQTDNMVLAAGQGPLVISETRSAVNEVDLPADLEQPSGIHINADAIYVSTDQAELFAIDHDGSLLFQQDLLGGPLLLKQGSLESVVTFGRDVYGVGEIEEIGVWSLEAEGLVKAEAKPLQPPYDKLEFTGLTMFGGSLMAVDGDSTALHNLTTGKSFNLDFSAVLKEGRDPQELSFSGISADFSRLYLVTENYTSILIVHPNGWLVERVVDIDDVEASDISVYRGLIFITVDHNYFDEKLPILVYDNIAFELPM